MRRICQRLRWKSLEICCRPASPPHREPSKSIAPTLVRPLSFVHWNSCPRQCKNLHNAGGKPPPTGGEQAARFCKCHQRVLFPRDAVTGTSKRPTPWRLGCNAPTRTAHLAVTNHGSCHFGDPRVDFRISSNAAVFPRSHPALFPVAYAQYASDRPRNVENRFSTNVSRSISY